MFATMAVTAQTDKHQRCRQALCTMEYVDAAEEYLKVDKKDAYVNKQLAESYYNDLTARKR